jgi:hypothetical protein
MCFAFGKLKLHLVEQRRFLQNKILFDIDKISSIENSMRDSSIINIGSKTKMINVTYVPIRLNPEKINDLSHRKSAYTCR